MKNKTKHLFCPALTLHYLCPHKPKRMHTLMKRLVLILMLILPMAVSAQTGKNDMSRYLEGAVPTRDGLVYFDKTYTVEGKTGGELYSQLRRYVQDQIVKGENSLEQSRITELDSAAGLIVASIEETLYFKRKAWVSDFTRFFYQLIIRTEDGKFSIEMRRLHYLYEPTEQYGITTTYPAEKWITDEEALNKDKTKLTRVGGKFRRFTIDRKDEIFTGAARTVEAVKRVTRVIEVEE